MSLFLLNYVQRQNTLYYIKVLRFVQYKVIKPVIWFSWLRKDFTLVLLRNNPKPPVIHCNIFVYLQREFYRYSSNPRAAEPQLVDFLESSTGFCKIQFIQIANCLLDAVFTCFYFVPLATVSIPVAAKAVFPNNQCVLVVFTQFVCRIHSQMNSKLTEEYRVSFCKACGREVISLKW